MAEHHPNNIGDTKDFRFRVVRTFKSPLLRQIWEAVKIYENKADIVMSSKSEWHQPAVDRLVVTREIQTRQGKDFLTGPAPKMSKC